MSSFCVTLFDTIENPAEQDACFLTATRNLTINKGSGYRIIFSVSKGSQPADLTGYSLRGQIRPSESSSLSLLNLTTANLLLKVDVENSRIIMNLPESFTRRVSQDYAIYDIELLSPTSDAYKIITGLISFVGSAYSSGDLITNIVDLSQNNDSVYIDEAPSDGITYGRRNRNWVDLTSPANLQFRRGTSSEVVSIIPLEAEPVWATDTKLLYVGDGSTSGGVPLGKFPLDGTAAILTSGSYTPSKIFVADAMQPTGLVGATPYVRGNNRGVGSIDLQTMRTSGTQIAAGSSSAILCGSFNTASGVFGTIVNGQANRTLSTRSTILNGFNCTASGEQALVLNGNSSSALGTNNLVYNGTASSGTGSLAFNGNVVGTGSIALNGFSVVTSSYSIGINGATADRNSMFARAGAWITNFWDRGQDVSFLMRGYTTTSGAAELTTGGFNTPLPKLTIPSGVLLCGTAEVIGTVITNAANVCHYLRKFTIMNVAGTTSMPELTTLGTDYVSNTGLGLSISADNTGDFLKVEVTGLASTNIKWLAVIRGIEVSLNSSSGSPGSIGGGGI